MASEFKVPARQLLWQSITKASGKRYIITSNQVRNKYHLYEVGDGDDLSRLGTAPDPILLKEKYLKE